MAAPPDRGTGAPQVGGTHRPRRATQGEQPTSRHAVTHCSPKTTRMARSLDTPFMDPLDTPLMDLRDLDAATPMVTDEDLVDPATENGGHARHPLPRLGMSYRMGPGRALHLAYIENVRSPSAHTLSPVALGAIAIDHHYQLPGSFGRKRVCSPSTGSSCATGWAYRRCITRRRLVRRLRSCPAASAFVWPLALPSG